MQVRSTTAAMAGCVAGTPANLTQAYVCAIVGGGSSGGVCGLVSRRGSGGRFLIFGAPSRISFSKPATNARSCADVGGRLRGGRVAEAGRDRDRGMSVLAKRGALMSLRRPTMR